MIYHLGDFLLQRTETGLALFRYITFRAAMAAVTALLLSWLLGPWAIRRLRRLKGEDTSKTDSAALRDLHAIKRGTPTMGGLLILGTIGVATLLWARWDHGYTWLALGTMVYLGAVGAVDDYIKMTRPGAKGLTPRAKLWAQAILGLAVGLWLWQYQDVRLPRLAPRARPQAADSLRATWSPRKVLGSAAPPAHEPIESSERLPGRPAAWLHLPLAKDIQLPLGLGFFLFAAIVLVGSSNAVNLTDGLDGLATGVLVPVAGALTLLCYVAGRVDFSAYLAVPYVPGAGELAVVMAAVLGAALGFLWFNGYPAAVFMGDTGSLALGGLLGLAALVAKQELLLALAGGIFVAEAISVIVQRYYYKLSGGQRVFRCAPLHHHFEVGGTPESKVTLRFWILSSVLSVLALASLKVR